MSKAANRDGALNAANQLLNRLRSAGATRAKVRVEGEQGMTQTIVVMHVPGDFRRLVHAHEGHFPVSLRD